MNLSSLFAQPSDSIASIWITGYFSSSYVPQAWVCSEVRIFRRIGFRLSRWFLGGPGFSVAWVYERPGFLGGGPDFSEVWLSLWSGFLDGPGSSVARVSHRSRFLRVLGFS